MPSARFRGGTRKYLEELGQDAVDRIVDHFPRSLVLPPPPLPPWGSDNTRRTRCKLSPTQALLALPESCPASVPACSAFCGAPLPSFGVGPQSPSQVSLPSEASASSRSFRLLPRGVIPPEPRRSPGIPALEASPLIDLRCPHLGAAFPPPRRYSDTAPSTSLLPWTAPLSTHELCS